MVHVAVLGVPVVMRDGSPVEFSTNKVRALLFYLVVQRRWCTRHELMGLLWGNSAEKSARTSLRVALTDLRKNLPGVIVSDNERVGLETEAISADLWQFQSKTDNLQATTDLYRGEFLETFQVRRAVAFEEWVVVERERLRQMASQLLERLADEQTAARSIEAAITTTRRLLTLDTWREEVHRRLMRLFAEAGRTADALAQFEQCKQILADELGVEPATETLALLEEIRQGRMEPASTADAGKAFTPPENLPRPRTDFVGRGEQVAEITERLQSDGARLITLVGAGGMGKTRLAIASATQLRETIPTTFVTLEAIENTGGINPIVQAIGETLEISLNSRQPTVEQLVDVVGDEAWLLVLDNVEHLIDQVAVLDDLLEQMPGLQIMATSRERLNLLDEWLIEVDGLPQDEAVALFTKRARRIRPKFNPQKESASISAICDLVGGMPLAIELATTWLRTLPCPAIAERIRDDLDLLSTRLRNLPERHRSLRAVFDYSWQQLTEKEQITLARLSVFHGGCRVDSAETVAKTDAHTLAALVDKSLLRLEENGRYTFHPAVRQYAGVRLDAVEGVVISAEAHALYFAEKLNTIKDVLRGGDRTTLENIDDDFDNIRAMWQHAIDTQNAGIIGLAGEGWGVLYAMRGMLLEGRERTGDALAMLNALKTDNPIPKLIALTLTSIFHGIFHVRLGLFTDAEPILWQAHEYSKLINFRPGISYTLNMLGQAAYLGGDLATARQRYFEALELAETDSLIDLIVAALHNLCNVQFIMGEFDEALDLIERSITLRHTHDDQLGLGSDYNTLADVLAMKGDYAKMNEIAKRAVTIHRAANLRMALAYSLNVYGYSFVLLGELDAARPYFEESLLIGREMRQTRYIAYSLSGLADIAEANGDKQEALRLMREALAVIDEAEELLSRVDLLTQIGFLCVDVGELDSAENALNEAWHLTHTTGATTNVLTILVGYSHLQLAQNETTPARYLLTLAATHPATPAHTRTTAKNLLTTIPVKHH